MDKKEFWSSLPGMLTGIAAIVTAGTGVYLAVRGGAPPKPPSEINDGRGGGAGESRGRGSAVAEWPVVARETFSSAQTSWPLGNHPETSVRRFDLSLTGGAYRWDLDFEKDLSKSINIPLGFFTDFSAAIDVTVRQRTIDPLDIGLTFGGADGSGFRLLLKSPGQVGVSRTVGSTVNEIVMAWVPVDAPLDRRNRLAVQVDGSQMSFYVNDALVGKYVDARYRGGILGLSVGAYSPGTAVIDFDNFEVRRKP